MVAFQYLLASFSVTVVVSALPGHLSQRPPTERELSAPGTVFKRATGSRKDPHILNINCGDNRGSGNGWDLCECDAHGILCKRMPNPTQYGGGISDVNRGLSGYSSSLLRSSNANRLSHGVDISDDTLDRVGRSMEEGNMAMAIYGGEGEVMYAADAKQNSLIGSRVGNAARKEKVKKEMWYLRWFTNWNSYERKKYLPALQCGCDWNREFCPKCDPDYSACVATDDPLDPANRAFTASHVDENNAANNRYHMMGPDDIWTGHYWGGNNKERGLVGREDHRYAEQYYEGGPNANIPESEKYFTPPDDSDPGEFTLPE